MAHRRGIKFVPLTLFLNSDEAFLGQTLIETSLDDNRVNESFAKQR